MPGALYQDPLLGRDQWQWVEKALGGEQLGFWFPVGQEAWCGRSSLVPSSAGDAVGGGRAFWAWRAGPRHWEEECQGDNRLSWPSSGPGMTSWGRGQELQMPKGSAKPSSRSR